MKRLVDFVLGWLKDKFTSQPCVLREEIQLDNGKTVSSCVCDPVGDCSLIYEGKCWIDGRKKPFITPFKFRRMVKKGLVFNCMTHQWQKRDEDGRD